VIIAAKLLWFKGLSDFHAFPTVNREPELLPKFHSSSFEEVNCGHPLCV
jgi:hypothetical protein